MHLGCNLSGVFFQDILKIHHSSKKDPETDEIKDCNRYEYGQITFYEWTDISHVAYTKTLFSLDMEREETPIQFQLVSFVVNVVVYYSNKLCIDRRKLKAPNIYAELLKRSENFTQLIKLPQGIVIVKIECLSYRYVIEFSFYG